MMARSAKTLAVTQAAESRSEVLILAEALTAQPTPQLPGALPSWVSRAPCANVCLPASVCCFLAPDSYTWVAS